jgi:hypothetical protein
MIEAGADRVPSRRENDGDDRRRLLGGQDHASARRDNNINLALDELGGNLSGALGSTLSPAILDCDCPSTQPSSSNRCTKAAVHWLWAEAVVAPRNPTVGSFGCCARARFASAASSRPPPPTRAMNSRRFMSSMGTSSPTPVSAPTGPFGRFAARSDCL